MYYLTSCQFNELQNCANMVVNIISCMQQQTVLSTLAANQVAPQKGNYNAVRIYVEERIAQDIIFKEYWNLHKWQEKADYLSSIFGWQIDEHSLMVNWNRNN